MIVTYILKYWKPLAVAILLIATFVAGVRYKSATCEVEKLELVAKYTEMIQAEVDRRYQLSVEYEERMAEFRLQTNQIMDKIKTEVSKPIYRDCKVPESGTKILNDTILKFNQSRKQ